MEKFVHKLEYLVFEFLEKHDLIDVTDLSCYLGACTRPEIGVKSYRIVASDILEVLVKNGKLIRKGNGDNKRPYLGGFYYTKVIKK